MPAIQGSLHDPTTLSGIQAWLQLLPAVFLQDPTTPSGSFSRWQERPCNFQQCLDATHQFYTHTYTMRFLKFLSRESATVSGHRYEGGYIHPFGSGPGGQHSTLIMTMSKRMEYIAFHRGRLKLVIMHVIGRVRNLWKQIMKAKCESLNLKKPLQFMEDS